MSNDQTGRRPPAKPGGGAPMGSTISIVIAVVAVVVGFIILRNINDDSNAGGPSTPGITLPTTGDTTGTTAVSTPPSVADTSTTTPFTVTSKVIVANASGTKGAAGFATTALTEAGFTLGTPTDAFGPEKIITTTKVYYVAGAEATAASVASMFSTPTAPVQTAPMPTLIPVQGATIGDAQVLVMVGTDLANKPLPGLAAATPTTVATATTVP